MIENGFWSNSAYRVPAWRSSFDTASGKLEFVPSNGNNGSMGILEKPERFAPVAPQGDGATYPLVLIPYDSMRLAGGFIGNPPFLTKTVGDNVLKGNDSFVEVNPKTAGAAGLSEGSILLTGLTTIQVIRTAMVAGVGAVIFVRGKTPPQEVIDLAKENNLPLISSPYSMFVSCGRLHACNLTGLDGRR